MPATSILAPQIYLDAIGKALAEFASAREKGNPSIVQHTLDNYADVLLTSCWPMPATNCHWSLLSLMASRAGALISGYPV